EFENMPKRIRNMLTPPRNTTQRDPVMTQPQAPHAKTDPAPDETAIRAQVLAEHKARVNAIGDLFDMFGNKHMDMQNQCVADPECSVDKAKDVLLAELGKTATPSNKSTQPHIHAGTGNFFADGIRQALMARAGFEGQEREYCLNG
ncbi:Clp protease ClpP, partial [Enterobacter cloacae subsp. dissolvens]|nr:Clp protease ClpP [Enterobacter cloacae subsp. dissolvens]